MAYTIVKTNGTVLCTIADGTINTTAASIGLPGRNYAGYGQQLDTNFVHTLENFCGPTPPPNALQGQLWFNSATQTMYVCPSDGEANASLWLSLATASSGSSTTFGTINVSGNATVGNLITSGGISAAGAVTVGSLTVQANTVTANANVTGNLAASGNLIVANITTGSASTPGAITGTYTVTGGNTGNALIVAGGNVTVSNVAGAGIKADNYYYANGVAINLAGSYGDSNVRTLLTTGVPNVYVQTTLTSRTLSTGASATTGSITGAWTVAAGSTLEATSALTAGTVTTPAQTNITSLGTLTALNVTGNTVSGNVYANTGTVRGSLLTGTLTTALQPNITNVGVLTSLTVSGTANLGSIANVKITGGSAGQSITTDGLGNLTFTTISTGSLSNGTSNIAVLNSSNITFSAAGTANVLTITSTGANITGTLNTGSGNATVGNLITSLITGTLTTTSSAQPNITSLGTLTNVTVTGNTVSGNVYANSGTVRGSLLTGTLTTALQPNITNVGVLTTLTVSGNITGGNLVANVANGNSSISIPAANGNINLNAAGSATPELIITSAGANINGTAQITGDTSMLGRVIATPDGSAGSYYLPGFSTNYGPGIVGAGTSYSYTGGAAWQALSQWSTSVSASGGAYLSLNKSNSATYGTHGAVSVDTTVGAIGFSGSDGAKFVGTADIVSQVDGAVATSSVPGRLVFKTNQGGAAPVEAMRIDSNGYLGISTTTPAYELDVSGNARVTNSVGIGTTPSGTTGTLITAGAANIGGSLYLPNNATYVYGTLSDGVTQTRMMGINSANTVFVGAIDAQTNLTSVRLNAPLNADLNLYANNAFTAKFAANGLIGLGTSAPAYDVDMSGNARITTSLGVGTTPSGTAGEIKATTLTISGNITGANLIGSHANGTSSVNMPASGGNINLTAGGTTSLVVTSTGANITGTLNATGNANVGNIGATTAIFTTGNITTVNGNLANATSIIANGTNGRVIANNFTISGAASGNINASSTSGNLGITVLAATYTDNVSAAGTIANAAIHTIAVPTVTASNAITTTNLSTFYIAGLPVASTNVTATNRYSMFVAAGNSYYGGQIVSGVTTGTAPFVVNSTTTVANLAAATAGSATTFTSTTQNSQFNSIGVGTAGSGTAGEIRATNNITAYYSSDSRLKENVQPITGAIDLLEQINGVRFDWTEDYIKSAGGEDGYFVRKNDVGVIAQEVQKVLPEIVAEKQDGYLAVKYERIVALLIQAVKEQQVIIDQQNAKIDQILSKLQG